MAYEYDIDTQAGLVRLRNLGAADFSGWEKTMRALVRDPAYKEGMPVLFDVRQETLLPPPGESGRFADGWRRLVPASLVALVAPPGGAAFGVIRQVSALTNGQAEAFSDPAEAEAWLVSHRHAART
jgi:hypothetical protein